MFYFLVSRFIYWYANCHNAECCFAECHFAEYRFHECHFAECCYVQCRGLSLLNYNFKFQFLITLDMVYYLAYLLLLITAAYILYDCKLHIRHHDL
jgi:hypothetical protein